MTDPVSGQPTPAPPAQEKDLKALAPSAHSLPTTPSDHATQLGGEAEDDTMLLLARCRAGEPGAWRSFYRRHFGFVFATARRLGCEPADAEDVAHDVFVVAFRKLHQFREGKVTTWLYRITANITSDRHRRRRVREAFVRLGVLFGAASPATPEELAVSNDTQRTVAELLARMKPKKREVLALYELEGLSGPEIAERLGCPEKTVWTRLHHARRQFAALAQKRGLAPLREVTR